MSIPEKLRSTCNSCAVSKVRCTKTKPTCQRCESYKLECIYGPSQRRGKPPAAAKKAQQQQTAIQERNHSRADELDLGSLFTTASTSTTTTSSSSSSSLQDFPPGNSSSNSSNHMLVDSAMWTDYDSFSPSLPTGSMSGTSNGLGQELLLSNMNISAISTDSAVHPPVTATTAIPFSHDNSHHNICVRTALGIGMPCSSIIFYTLSTLCHLRNPPTIPSPPGGGTPPLNTETILQTNNTAIQRLSQVVLAENCTTCLLRDPSVAYMAYTTIVKILSEYAAILDGLAMTMTTTTMTSNINTNANTGSDISTTRSCNCNCNCNCDYSYLTTSLFHHNHQQHQAATTITIGEYRISLDGEQEKRIRAQLLSCELQKVGRILEALNGSVNVKSRVNGNGNVRRAGGIVRGIAGGIAEGGGGHGDDDNDNNDDDAVDMNVTSALDRMLTMRLNRLLAKVTAIVMQV